MIVTVTINAAVDRTIIVKNLEKGKVQHGKLISALPGGKGLNVARALKKLGNKVLVTGFVGGKNGEYIIEKLEKEGINFDFVKIKGDSRECLTIIDSETNIITEINEDGPIVTQKELEKLIKKIENFKPKPKLIVFSGSVPPCLKNDIYKQLIKIAKKREIKTVLDAKEIYLEEGIKEKPFIIKPNKIEAEFLLKHPLNTKEQILHGIKFFLDKGIKIVAISFDKHGAFIGTSEGIWEFIAPTVKTVNTVGSGDVYLAGLINGIIKNQSIIESGKLAIACGTANTLCQGAGIFKKSDIKKLLPLIKIKEFERF